MSSATYADAYGAFLAGGFGAKSEVLPTGSYPVRIALVKGDQAQGKSFRVGVRIVVLDGHPKAGAGAWLNQTLTLPVPGNDKSTTAFMMFLKFMVALGGDLVNEAIKQGTPPEKLHELIVVGTEGSMQLKGDRIYKPVGGEPRAQQDFVAFDVTAIPSPMGGMIAVGTAQPAPVAPVAAPAPVPVAVAVPAPAPVAVAAPVTVQTADAAVQVEALQAQLAALQAAQAPAAVPAAAAAPGPSF